MNRFFRPIPALAAISACLPVAAVAAEDPAMPVVGTGSVLQVLLGLAVVLGMVFAAAWAIRRFNPNAMAGGGIVRVVGGTSVGNRERVLVVEVDDTWLVIGVAPGRVSQLHSLPRPPQAEAVPAPAVPGAGFAAWLRQTIESRNAVRPGK